MKRIYHKWTWSDKKPVKIKLVKLHDGKRNGVYCTPEDYEQRARNLEEAMLGDHWIRTFHLNEDLFNTESECAIGMLQKMADGSRDLNTITITFTGTPIVCDVVL